MLYFAPSFTRAASISCDYGGLSCSATDSANSSCPSVPTNTACSCSGNDIPSCIRVDIPQYCSPNSPCGGAIMYSPLIPEANAWDTNCCAPQTGWGCQCLPGLFAASFSLNHIGSGLSTLSLKKVSDGSTVLSLSINNGPGQNSVMVYPPPVSAVIMPTATGFGGWRQVSSLTNRTAVIY